MSWLLSRFKSNNFYKHLCHTHQIRKIARVAPIRSAASKDAGFLNKLRNVFRHTDYEFSETKLSPRAIPEVYTERLGSPGRRLEFLQKAHVDILIKRHMSGMAVRTPKPPISEPNMPQRSIRREESSKKKERKKKKKPVMYVQGAKAEEPQPQSPPSPEFTRVYRNRWGVRLFEDQNPTVESTAIMTHQLVPVASPIGGRKLERRKSSSPNSPPKIRLALVSGEDFDMNQPRVRRPMRELPHKSNNEEHQQLDAQMSKIHEATLPDHEVLAPTDFGAKSLLLAWQSAIVNSHPSKSSLTERQLPSMLGNIEAVFIQPEAPSGSKANGPGTRSLKVKGSPVGQPSARYSTFTPVGGETKSADAPKPLSLPSVESFDTRESENESMKKFSSDLDSVLELECEKKKKKEEAVKAQSRASVDDEYDIRDSMKIRHDQKFEFGKYENGVYKRLKMDREKGEPKEFGDDTSIIVKIDGDPYPYSKEYFEKWRAPPYKPFNIHRIPVKPKHH